MTRRTRFAAFPALALLAGLAACGGDAPESGPMTAVEEEGAPAPETKTATVVVRGRDTAAETGQAVELAFKRFDAPPDFPLQFATYVPEDLIVETLKAGKAEGVRIISNIGGHRKESAYFWAMFHPPGTAEARAREAYAGLVEKRGNPAEVPERARRFAWALAEHEFRYQPRQGETRVGRLALGRRGDRFFHLIIEYPEDLAGEFVPRINRVLEDWRWKDDGGRIGDARSSR